MQLLISDANILIDMEAGQLLKTFFRLPYRFGMPDSVYAEEIEPGTPGLDGLGLRLLEVRGDWVNYALGLTEKYTEQFKGKKVRRQITTTIWLSRQRSKNVVECSLGTEISGSLLSQRTSYFLEQFGYWRKCSRLVCLKLTHVKGPSLG